MSFQSLLIDTDKKPQYRCSVCKKIGLITRPGVIPEQIPINICHNCGYIWKYYRNLSDEKKWLDAWKENGSIVLYDLSLQERCELFEKIQDTFNRKKYYCLSDEQIQNREIDERVFTQHGFKRIVRKKSIIVNSTGKKAELYKYETNKLINISGYDGYISIVENNKSVLLLASDYLSASGEGVSSPARLFYPGLMPHLFARVYILNERCVLRDKEGHMYVVSLV